MLLIVRATPNAKNSCLIGWETDSVSGRYLRIRIAAPPVEGKANKEMSLFLAKSFNLPKSSVKLLKGETSRLKRFEIDASETEILERIERMLSSPG